MNKGHLDAQLYRFDFVKIVIDEMIREISGSEKVDHDDIYKKHKDGTL